MFLLFTHKVEKKLAISKGGNKILERLFKFNVDNRLEDFRQYTREIETKFHFDKEALSKSYEDAIKGLSEDEKSEVDEYFYDDFYIIEKVQINMYRNSVIVSIYSFLENSLNKLCKYLSKKHSYAITVDDLKGDGIVRAKHYLEKMAQVNFSAINGEWSDLRTLNKIRNCIVHSEGIIINNESLKNIITQTSGVSLNDGCHILIEREYIDFSINTVEKFLDKLYQQIFF